MSIPANTTSSLTIGEFCAAERISRSMFYKLRRTGDAPRLMQVGSAVRISPEAHAAWRRAREAAAAATSRVT